MEFARWVQQRGEIDIQPDKRSITVSAENNTDGDGPANVGLHVVHLRRHM